MLLDDIDKVNALGQTGVLTGTTSYSFLGDPSKGVYISMYSDCLELQPWRNTESGYIAIIRLTTGRVRRIPESHGQGVPAPTSGYDCHVSQNLSLVSPKTSLLLAFKRTQCYIYELLDDGSDGTTKSPSFTCPFGVVAFKYSIKGKGRRKRWTPLAIKMDTQPRDLMASKILRVLPVLGYAGGDVEKTNTDPNKGVYNVVTHPVRTYTVLLNPVLQPCPPAGPGVHYIALSSPEPVQASPVQMGSEKTLNCEMECGKNEVGVKAPQTLPRNEPRAPNEADDPELKNLPTPSTSDDVPSELIVSFTSEQSVPKKRSISPVSTRKPLSDEPKRTLECPKIANVTMEQQNYSTKGHKKTTKAFIETPALEKVQRPSEDDTLNSQTDQKTESSNQLHQNATSNKDRRTFPGHTFGICSSRNKKVRPVAVERGTSDAERQTMGSTVTGRETPKCERWNLKPVISECGRTLVPHGSRRKAAHMRKSLPEQDLFRSRPNKASDAVGETEQQSIIPPGSGTGETEVVESKTVANYPENVSPEQSTVHDSGYGEDAFPAEDIQESSTTTSSDRRVEEDEPKCILSNRARTKHHLSLNVTTEDQTTETELPLKKSKSHTEVNPKVADEAPSATKDTDVRDTQDSTQAATIKRRPSSIFPMWKQFKKLKKQQAISKLHIKKKWRLHFQTSLDESGKQSAWDDTIWKKNNISNTSTDALNLLADLALGATNEQVLSQPGQELMSKGVASTDKVSLLHALLGKPVFNPTQPLESQSVLAGDLDLVSLLREEHAYSISQFVPLALPGKEFQVCPLSGSTGLLHHHQTMCSGQTLQFSDDQSENSQVSSKHARKRMTRFQRYRRFVEEGGFIKVTRQWQETYDFGGDSRFSVGLKNRSIIRALHGPWDISIQDTNKDIQLVVHMWIGLFYSRSTARFFDVDLDLENLEEMDCLETTPAQSDFKENTFELPPGVVDTAESSISNSLVLSQKGTDLDQESEILDLSLKNPNVESLTSGPTFVECQTTILPAETSNKCNDVSTECCRTNFQEDSYLKDEGEPSLHEDVTDNHLQGQLENNENHDVTRMDHGLHESDSDGMDLEVESENLGARVLSMALNHGEDSLGAKNEVYKDMVNPVPQIEDDKESDTFCEESILAAEILLPRDDPEDVQVDNLNDETDYFVKNDILISTRFSVQQGIDTVLPTSNTDDRLSEMKTTDVEHALDQPSETNKYTSTFPAVSDCTKNKNAQPVQAASTSQSPQSSESSEDPVALPLNNKSMVNHLITEDTSDINVLDAIEVDETSQRTSRNVIAESAILSTDVTLQCCPSDFQMDERNDPGDPFQFLDPLRQDDGESVPNTLKASQTKYRFYILEKSEDSFYAETKSQLESEGHIAVQPSRFFVAGEDRSPLLIVVRNEDIAASICQVPHLLELKKSLGVQFVGIDEPSDVMNRTYQELFVNGGFVMFDGGTLESLSLNNMRRFMEILQDLNKTGKWKWFLHYRDSRRIKENARFSTDSEEKKHFLGWAEDAGLATVLPYHDCDIKSRPHPDYLACLVHLQAQNISSRFPVFITDAGDGDFEASGILTTTIGSFLMSFR
ncbi:protein TASOR 2 isoform X2 [Nerophis ophidion]|nr:protein TASOR 2 isoform X2 [Nerophis ophidion]